MAIGFVFSRVPFHDFHRVCHFSRIWPSSVVYFYALGVFEWMKKVGEVFVGLIISLHGVALI